MSILSRLFGGGARKRARENPEEFIAEVEELASRDPGGAHKLLLKNASAIDDLVLEGRPLHDRFVRLALRVIAKKWEQKPPRGWTRGIEPDPVSLLRSFHRIGWDEIEDLKWLLDRADGVTEELIWVSADPEDEGSLFDRIAMLYNFATTPKLAVSFMEEGIPMVIRRSFLQRARAKLPSWLQVEDLGQGLIDTAIQSGHLWNQF